jgi:signal transduction histidine kinase
MNSRLLDRPQFHSHRGQNGIARNGSNPVVSSFALGKAAPQSASSKLAEMALSQAPVALVVCDLNYKIKLANAMARQAVSTDLCGQSMKSASEIWGEVVDAHGCPVPEEEWPWVKAIHGIPTQCQEIEFVAPNGKSWLAQISSTPLLSGKRIIGAATVFVDVSARRRQEFICKDQMLTSERTRIAGNIHDNVSQDLNASILHLRAARKEMADYIRATRTHLGKAIERSMCSLAEARRATAVCSYDLGVTDDPATKLRTIAKQLFLESSVELEFSLQGPMNGLSSASHLELIRIGKEALNNIAKHARASRVAISLRYGKRHAVLNVSDNGCGFSFAPSPEAKEGFGLVSMRSRAKEVGGNVRIQSKLGRGTSVVALLPI